MHVLHLPQLCTEFESSQACLHLLDSPVYLVLTLPARIITAGHAVLSLFICDSQPRWSGPGRLGGCTMLRLDAWQGSTQPGCLPCDVQQCLCFAGLGRHTFLGQAMCSVFSGVACSFLAPPIVVSLASLCCCAGLQCPQLGPSAGDVCWCVHVQWFVLHCVCICMGRLLKLRV